MWGFVPFGPIWGVSSFGFTIPWDITRTLCLHGGKGLVWAPCETPRKSNFLKKGKIVISIKIRNFSRSQMTKRISPLESSCEI